MKQTKSGFNLQRWCAQLLLIVASALVISACASHKSSNEAKIQTEAILNSPHLIVYFSPTCSHCSKAKAWLEQQGIPYEGRDVTVRQYKDEFRALGGSGVPFFVKGGKFLEGFSEQHLRSFLAR